MEDTKKLIEKYKRELMEMSRTAPQPARSDSPAPTSEKTEKKPQPAKAPKIIGYVSEESGEFPSVFDRFFAESAENDENEIETADAPQADEEVVTPRQDLFDIESGDPEGDAVSNDVRGTEEDTPPPEKPVGANDVRGEEEGTPFPEEFAGSTDVRNEERIPSTDETEPAQNESTPAADARQSEMSQGSGEPIGNFTIPKYSSAEEFEANNTGGGFLEFRVFEASQALPIENAEISVTTRINGEDHPMFNTTTNNSGETEMFTLPAPSAKLSQSSDNKIQPFALYDAAVSKDGYANVIIRDIPIFDGVQSVQRVTMLTEAVDRE